MKGIQEISCLRNIRSVHSVGARSIPKVQRSSYLELYILKREKDRLEKEIGMLEKRKNAADRQLESVTNRIKKLQKETNEEKKIKTYKSVPTRPLKSMAIHY